LKVEPGDPGSWTISSGATDSADHADSALPLRPTETLRLSPAEAQAALFRSHDGLATGAEGGTFP